MKVKITYTPEQENAAQATLDALRAMYPAARVHESRGFCRVFDGYKTGKAA